MEFHKQRTDRREMANAYYRMLSAWFNLRLTDLHIKFIVHLVLNNGIASAVSKRKFMQTYPEISQASLDNLVSRLRKRKLLVGDKGKAAQLHPKLMFDFNDSQYKLQFTCVLKQEVTHHQEQEARQMQLT